MPYCLSEHLKYSELDMMAFDILSSFIANSI